MTTVVFELPLLGGSGNHREQFSALDRIVSANPDKLIIKLMGPGGLAPEAVLAYHDMLGTLTYGTEIITISYSNLIGGDLALFLLGDPRDIRPNAWCYVHSTPSLPFETERGAEQEHSVTVVNHDEGHLTPLDWRNYCWDYGKCLKLINQHVDVSEFLDRRLDASALKEHLVVGSGEVDALLLRHLGRIDSTPSAAINSTIKPVRTPRRRIKPLPE